MMVIGLLLMNGQVVQLNAVEEHKLNKDNVYPLKKMEKPVWEKKFLLDLVMKMIAQDLILKSQKFYLWLLKLFNSHKDLGERKDVSLKKEIWILLELIWINLFKNQEFHLELY